MKILMSCFACNPFEGSEPGIGWQWPNCISMNDENRVYVITRSIYRNMIEKVTNNSKSNITFYYHDIKPLKWIVNSLPLGIQLYYLLWQFTMIKKLIRIHKVEKFDIAHHITFATIKFPSLLYKLNIPVIIGPAGGGEKTPRELFRIFSLKEKIKEIIRLVHIRISSYDYFVNRTLETANKLIVTTPACIEILPRKYRDKSVVMQTIGINISDEANMTLREDTKFRILYVGRLLELKGVLLIPKIIKILSDKVDNIEVTIIGEGPCKKKLVSLIEEENLKDKFIFSGNLNREKVFEYYRNSDVFLFPSMHDSGAMVVVEAMINKLLVVCLDTGGPGLNIGENSGIKINPNQELSEVVGDFANKLMYIYMNINNEDLNKMRENAYQKVLNEFIWEKKALEIQKIYNIILNSV